MHSKRIDQLEKLRVRTTKRGASTAEADTAALIIGRMLMREDGLVISQGELTRIPDPIPDPITVSHGIVTLKNVSVKVSTLKAILCLVPSFGEIWIPKSQVRNGNEVFRCGDYGNLVITEWIARQKGILAA